MDGQAPAGSPIGVPVGVPTGVPTGLTGGLTRGLPDAVVRYAAHADGILDVHLPPPASVPASPGRRHVVVLLHGGFWKAAYDRTHTRPLAVALAGRGLVVVTPEYRRVGGAGPLAGGWPATVADVESALVAVPDALDRIGLGTGSEPSRTTVVGHSAGGHLALWLANQGHAVDHVVALAPVGDLRAAAHDRLGDGAVKAFLGGEPADLPERYDAADPATRLRERPACPVTVVHGADDEDVPVTHSRGLALAHPYVELRELPGTGHMELVDPASSAWPVVLEAIVGPTAGDGTGR